MMMLGGLLRWARGVVDSLSDGLRLDGVEWDFGVFDGFI